MEGRRRAKIPHRHDLCDPRLAGVVIGFVGGAFRWCLVRAGDSASDPVDWSHDLARPGWVLPLVLAAMAAVIAGIIVLWVRFAAAAASSTSKACGAARPSSHQASRVVPAIRGGVLTLSVELVLSQEEADPCRSSA